MDRPAKKSKLETTNFLHLSLDLVCVLAGFLELGDAFTLCKVCKNFNQKFSSARVWEILSLRFNLQQDTAKHDALDILVYFKIPEAQVARLKRWLETVNCMPVNYHR